MTDRLSSQAVYDRAAYWAARIDAGPLSSDELAELEPWLAADPRHYGALAQATALLVPVGNSTVALENIPASRRRVVLGGSIAAGVTLMLGSAGYVIWRRGEGRYRTQVGEIRVVPLSDGSVVTLNTNSEIVVRFTKAQRLIELVHGEALFDVAKNKARPFIVRAAATQVRAVGTSFNVKALPDQPVQVLVREGVVEVKRPNVPVAPAVRLAMNNRAIAPQDAPIVAKPVASAEVGRELAWRVGRIAFHGETLAEATAEFARYSDVKIQIDDPAVANQRITGLFVSTDPVGFANAVAVSFELRSQIVDGKILLTRS